MIVMENYIKGLVTNDKRPDGRKLDQFRDIKIETGVIHNAEGSARVKIGSTDVIAGVKMSTGVPYPDKLEEGVLMTGAELSPLSSPDFETGPPSEDAIELARVVDRGIRESKMIDTKKLCIRKGELVWMVSVDVQIVNHGGNLIDAATMAAVAALQEAKIPELDGDKVVFGKRTDKNLPVTCKPAAVTFYKIGRKLIVDPTTEEEKTASTRLTVTTKDNGNICALQKGGMEPLSVEEIHSAFDNSVRIGKELRKKL